VANITNDLNSLAKKFSPAAKEVFAEFLRKTKRIENEISNVALSILVWGPGVRAAEALYRKRCEIRDTLRNLGNAAVFSEEMTCIEEDTSVTLSELAQAISADFIVVLLSSMGALAEVAMYSSDAEIGSKMLILAHEQSKGSFVNHALLGKTPQNVIYFSQQELEDCSLVNKVTQKLPALKCAKFLYFRQKKRWESGT
jgi:hypothetical protein